MTYKEYKVLSKGDFHALFPSTTSSNDNTFTTEKRKNQQENQLQRYQSKASAR